MYQGTHVRNRSVLNLCRPTHVTVINLLHNVYHYYRQFLPTYIIQMMPLTGHRLEEKITTMRKPLQDKLKDFVTLTQWDVSKPNYFRLKETAAKSHRALNKMCRDYEV